MMTAGRATAGGVVNDDGTMARIPDLIPFCEEHGLILTSIADLISYLDEFDVAAQSDKDNSSQVPALV